MNSIADIIKERDVIVASIKAEWAKAEDRKKIALKKLREEYMQLSKTNSNWAYFVDYEVAHDEDNKINEMTIIEVECPFCEGVKKVCQYNDNIVQKFKNLVDCPLCEGGGIAWFRYGVCKIPEGRGARGG